MCLRRAYFGSEEAKEVRCQPLVAWRSGRGSGFFVGGHRHACLFRSAILSGLG